MQRLPSSQVGLEIVGSLFFGEDREDEEERRKGPVD